MPCTPFSLGGKGEGYNVKPYGGLTFLVIEGNLSFEEGGLEPFPTLWGLLNSVFGIFLKRKKAF